jgi:CRISPR/Cas system-associated exonuclease Cas4 (RecB family)
LKKKCLEKLNEHLVSNKIRIEFDEFNEALYELIEFTKNGIGFILDLKLQQPKAQIFFEYPLPENHLNLRGFIDCLVINESQAQIYDFKRSAFSIGSKKDLIAFKKLQLWVYANAIRKKYNVEKIGYINISEIESSVFLECGDLLNESEVKLSELISKYTDDVHYKPMPRSKEVCTFCAVEKICHKGILNGQNS